MTTHTEETLKYVAILRIETALNQPTTGLTSVDLKTLQALADAADKAIQPCGCSGLLCSVHGDPRDTDLDVARLG